MNKSTEKVSHPLVTILSYCGLLCFVPLFMHKNDEFVQFHVKQGIALFMLEVFVLFLAGTVIGTLISVPLLILLAFTSLFGISSVLQSKETKIPLLYWMVDRFNI